MKKLSVFILILYVVLFCLVGCTGNKDQDINVGFRYLLDASPISDAGMAVVYNPTEVLDRENFKINLSYGWHDKNHYSHLFSDNEYLSNSVVKLVAFSSYEYFRELYCCIASIPNEMVDWSNLYEIKKFEGKDFFTDKYQIHLTEVYAGIKLDFRHAEDILIPSQILDVDYEMVTDSKGRNVRKNYFVLVLLLIHTDANTNEILTNCIGFASVRTKEYEDGRLFIEECWTQW